MAKFEVLVVIETDTKEQAIEIVSSRIYYDDGDSPYDYRIWENGVKEIN